ncbi:MAG: PEP/pyruvate-binding domain-containing protein [Syntrophobacteraceae bacterium]
MVYILSPQDELSRFDHAGGGKARQMAGLCRHGFPVPTWFCVATDAYSRFLAENPIDLNILAGETVARSASRIEAAFLKGTFPADVRDSVVAALRAFGLDECQVAVRSSGIGEDSAESSFAGLFCSFLCRQGWEQIEESIRRCWASAFSERVRCYQIQRGATTGCVGVIIQKMVAATTAGVSFSRNPIHPLDRSTLLISGVCGLGEGLVSGLLEADEFQVDRATLQTKTCHVAGKRQLVRRLPQGGTEVVDVSSEDQEKACLTPSQIQAIASLTLKAEQCFGAPQDCEWALEGDALFFLQSRRITSVPPLAYYCDDILGSQATLWDNSNIIESYCGVTTPLTFSFVNVAYKQVYLQFCRVMGVPEPVIEAHDSMFNNMLGLLRGRVYYNLIHWYRLLHLMPFAGGNRKFMETMMGVKQGLGPELIALFDFLKKPVKYSWSQKIILYSRLAFRMLTVNRIIRAFNGIIKTTCDAHVKRDYDLLSLQDATSLYHDLVHCVLKQWKAPIINDFRVMVCFGLLKSLTEKWLVAKGKSASLQNDLLVGEGDLESTEPTKMLMRIARAMSTIHLDEGGWLMERSPEDIAAHYAAGTAPAVFSRVLSEFLAAYGFRCINELKLEAPDLHDNPGFAVEAILSYMKMGTCSVESMEERELAIRRDAEKTVKETLRGVKRWCYFWILGHARRAVRDRENLRFSRTRVFGIARKLFRAVGRKLQALELIQNSDDVFYLTIDEVVSFVEGRSVAMDMRQAVLSRKREFDSYRATPPPPDRFLTYGAVGVANPFIQVLLDGDLLKDLNPCDDPNGLKGISCSPGVVEGVVRVVHGMEDAKGLRGEILVTERTDPGWVPLFPFCSGLLIERGSLLSHSAVVARELGIPTIVSISGGLTRRLKTGMRVRMDAGLGEICILDDASPKASKEGLRADAED